MPEREIVYANAVPARDEKMATLVEYNEHREHQEERESMGECVEDHQRIKRSAKADAWMTVRVVGENPVLDERGLGGADRDAAVLADAEVLGAAGLGRMDEAGAAGREAIGLAAGDARRCECGVGT